MPSPCLQPDHRPDDSFVETHLRHRGPAAPLGLGCGSPARVTLVLLGHRRASSVGGLGPRPRNPPRAKGMLMGLAWRYRVYRPFDRLLTAIFEARAPWPGLVAERLTGSWAPPRDRTTGSGLPELIDLDPFSLGRP